MRADEDDLIPERGVGTRNLGDHVVPARVRRLVFHPHLRIEADGRAVLSEPQDHVVVLRGENDARNAVILRVAVAQDEQRTVLALVRPEHQTDAELLENRHHVADWR